MEMQKPKTVNAENVFVVSSALALTPGNPAWTQQLFSVKSLQ